MKTMNTTTLHSNRLTPNGSRITQLASMHPNSRSWLTPGRHGSIHGRPFAVYLAALLFMALSISTTMATAISSNATGGGNWSAPATWTGGVVPATGDDVTIADGDTVIIDTAVPSAGSLASLTVGQGVSGILRFDGVAARAMSVSGNVGVASGGTFISQTAGTFTNTLTIGGNLSNAGIFDMSQGGTTLVCNVTFNKNGNQTISGAGATTRFNAITLNMGVSNANICEVTSSNFAAGAGFLTLTNGTLKMSGSFAFSNTFFSTAGYTIPATGGIWINNANVTVTGQNGSPTNNGLLRLTAGIYNVGTASGNSMGAGTGAVFTIEGGTMNVAGRLNSSSAVTYTQSGGAVNVSTVGNASSATPSFGFTSTAPTNFFNMSGGTINLVQRSTGATISDYNQQGVINFTGGTLNVGTGATATNFDFRIAGNMPNVVIDNTTNNKTAVAGATGYCYGNFTIQTGTTLKLNNAILNMLGSTFTNNGAIVDGLTGGFTTSRLQFAGAGAQSYTGTGTFGTASDPIFGFANINRGSGLTIDPAVSNINVARLLAFSGALINANKVSITQVGTNVVVCQRGGVAFLPVGTIDVTPSFNFQHIGILSLEFHVDKLSRPLL